MKTPLTEPEIDLAELTEAFGTDDKCRRVMEQLRWPEGSKCPRCDSKATKITNRFQYDCNKCHYQFSVTAGTIFHDSHLSLWKWFLATYLLCESKKGMSACQIQRTLGVSYKTAWYLCHRIRDAMKEVHPEKLKGTGEIDETYIYGKRRRGRRIPKKEVVIGLRQRNGDLRLIHAEDAQAFTIRKILMQHLVHGDVHTNTVESAFSLLKRGIFGTWHKVSAKHLPAYLDEMCFRFNNRKNSYLFRITIMKLISSPNLEYKDLIAKAGDAA